MQVQQVSVFLENKAGRLADVAAVLKDSGINTRALTIAESENYGILRMIVDKPDEAMSALKTAGFMAKRNPVLAVEIDDRKGLLYDIVKLCDNEAVNIEYMYSFVEQTSQKAILFLRFDETDKAAQMFATHGYKLLTPEEACRI